MDNYDQPPILLLPYNYPYYPKHIDNAGYEKVKDLLTWRADQAHLSKIKRESPKYNKLQNMAEQVMKRRNITIRRGSKHNKREDYELIQHLYNTGLEGLWGFVPLTDQEFESTVEELQQIYIPEMSTYAFVDGEPAGFFVGVPDMNQAFHHAYPNPKTPEIWTLLKVLWHWKIRPKIDRVRLALGSNRNIVNQQV